MKPLKSYRNKEAIMDAIIEVFKAREDWGDAIERETGSRPEDFKAQKAYDLAFQSFGGNSFAEGKYDVTKLEMYEYLQRAEYLFQQAKERHFQALYLATPEGRARQTELTERLGHEREKMWNYINEARENLGEWLRANCNCDRWNITRFGPDGIAFALKQDDGAIDATSTFQVVLNGDKLAILPHLTRIGDAAFQDGHVVKAMWIGWLVTDGHTEPLRVFLIDFRERQAAYNRTVGELQTALSNLGKHQ